MSYKINEKLKKELETLFEIGKKKDNRINYSIVLNVLLDYKFDMNNFDQIKEYFKEKNIQIVFDDDIEEWNDTVDYKAIQSIKPFDQTKIDIIMKPLTIDLLIKRIKYDEINLKTEFQRKEGLWDDGKKSRLIESLLLKIPLPSFYFDGTNNDNWLIIDGLQRLTAIKEFFVDKTLRLKELEFFNDLENCTLDELPRSFVRRMEETQLTTYIVNPNTPINVKYNIFKRINTGGLELSSQEIRNALYQGKATKLLKRLSENKYFLEATNKSIKTERMLDREIILRFIAYSIYGVEKYEGYLEIYLNNTMEILNKMSELEILEVEKLFNKSMKLAWEIFNIESFRKPSFNNRRNPINVGLFEVWSTIFSKINISKIDIILSRKNILIERYKNMFINDIEFISSLNSGKVAAVRKRFEKINNLVEEVIN